MTALFAYWKVRKSITIEDFWMTEPMGMQSLIHDIVSQDFHGDYKWMLFGHDDTFFFVNNVLELLQDFDPDMPYIITGSAC